MLNLFFIVLSCLVMISETVAKESHEVTVNHRGWFLTQVFDSFSKEYVNLASNDLSPTLELGAGGSATAVEVLSKRLGLGNPEALFINDLTQSVLDFAVEKNPDLKHSQVHLSPGEFPSETHFEENFFGTILASRMFHFVPDTRWQPGLRRIFSWLKPGGKFFITTGTYFIRSQSNRLSIIEKFKSSGSLWPASFSSGTEAYGGSSTSGPATLIDSQILERELHSAGFNILRTEYIDLRPVLPERFCLDGREAVGAVAIKPD